MRSLAAPLTAFAFLIVLGSVQASAQQAGASPQDALSKALFGYQHDPSSSITASSLQPVGHIWTRSAQPWIPVPAAKLNYEQQPPDILPFVRAWKSRTS
ncbi:MAG TPA: hypothetical protein VKM54_22030 [Myxococcota bacterium]|nr:hypothetical protein [Myxococcota bacterium]